MAPIGYADGLLKPANQVRAQKALVKQVPGSNLPKQPAKSKRVKQSVNEMLAVNHAVERLAAMNSPRLGEVARAALAVYKHCETQCEKHAAKHEICKKCANCCRDLEKAIAKLPA